MSGEPSDEEKRRILALHAEMFPKAEVSLKEWETIQLRAQLVELTRERDEARGHCIYFSQIIFRQRTALLACMTAFGQHDPGKPLPSDVRAKLLEQGWKALGEENL